MKKSLFTLALIAITFVSCDKGNKAEVTDAVAVTEEASINTIEFQTEESSVVKFTGFHALRTVPRTGEVRVSKGTFKISEGKLAAGSFTMDLNSLRIDVASVDNDSTKLPKLEGHLKSADFFNVEANPTANFELTSVEASEKEGFNSKVSGNLTILGNAKNISFNANVEVLENGVTLKSEVFTLNRADFGIQYNIEGPEGVAKDNAVSKDIDFEIDVTGVK